MKKIFFLLALSAVIFPEMSWSTDSRQLQQIEQKFDKNRMIVKLRELGVSASEDSYSDLLGNEAYTSKISARIKELEQQVGSLVNCIRTEQTNYEDTRTDQLKTNLINEINRLTNGSEQPFTVDIFDKLQSIIPVDKYEELRPIVWKILLFEEDEGILNSLEETLQQIQSEESMDETLLKMRSVFKVGCSHVLIKGSMASKLDILKVIVNESALSKEAKEACLGTLDRCSELLRYIESETSSTKLSFLKKKKEPELANKYKDPTEALLNFCNDADSHTYAFLYNEDYSDIKSSLDELEKKAILSAVKLHSTDEKMINFPYLSCKVIKTSGIFPISEDEGYLQAGLSMLGQDLAYLLKKLASSSSFDEIFTRGDYDAYCDKVDNQDIYKPNISLEKFPEFSGAYELIENAIRSSFEFWCNKKSKYFLGSIRIFVSSLRDIVRYNSDAVAKKQAIKRALTVLEAIGQTVPSLEEEVKDVQLDLNKEQLEKINKLKDKALPEMNKFLKEVAELEDVEEDVTVFSEELKNIATRGKLRFFEKNKANFNLMLQVTSELLEKRKAENEKDSADLQIKLTEIKDRLSQMTHDEIFKMMYPQSLSVQYPFLGYDMEVMKEFEIDKYLLNEKTEIDQVGTFLENRLGMRFYYGLISYLSKLAEYKIGLLKMLKSYAHIPQMIDNSLFLGIEISSEEGMEYYLNSIGSFANAQPELYQHWSQLLNQSLPMLRELDTLRTMKRLMNKDDSVPHILFNFDTQDGHFRTQIIREGNTIKNIEYDKVPSPKCKSIPVQLYDFFAAVDSDPKNIKKLANMLEDFSPEILNYAHFSSGKLPRWAVIAKHLIGIRQKGIEDKEKLYALYALATVSNDMSIEQIKNHLAKYVKNPKKVLSSLSREDFFCSDGAIKESCVPGRVKLFLLFDGNTNSEFQKDLLLSDTELDAEFSKYSLKKEISMSKLYEKLSEGSRYEKEGIDYFEEVFLRALEIIFDRKSNYYSSMASSGVAVCKQLKSDIENKAEALKPFIPAVEEGESLLRVVTSSLNAIASLLNNGYRITDIENINYLFRTLEKKIEKYQKVGDNDNTDEFEQKTDTDKLEITNLMGAIIQGLSNSLSEGALDIHYIINDMVKSDENMKKASTEDALRYLIQLCSTHYFDYIFHFAKVLDKDKKDFEFNIVESQKIKGIDSSSIGFDQEEIAIKNQLLGLFDGAYGLSRYVDERKIDKLEVSQLHLYVLDQVGKGNMTILKIMKNLYNSQDEIIRKYGANYSTGEVGENFYTWAFPVQINSQNAQFHMELDYEWPSATSDQEKLLKALLDESMQNIHNVTNYITGENCDSIWSIIENRFVSEEEDGDAVIKTKELVFDATANPEEEYKNYLNKRIAFYLLKKYKLLEAKLEQ